MARNFGRMRNPRPDGLLFIGAAPSSTQIDLSADRHAARRTGGRRARARGRPAGRRRAPRPASPPAATGRPAGRPARRRSRAPTATGMIRLTHSRARRLVGRTSRHVWSTSSSMVAPRSAPTTRPSANRVPNHHAGCLAASWNSTRIIATATATSGGTNSFQRRMVRRRISRSTRCTDTMAPSTSTRCRRLRWRITGGLRGTTLRWDR